VAAYTLVDFGRMGRQPLIGAPRNGAHRHMDQSWQAVFFSSSIADRIRFQIFVYFGKKYKDINDPNITKLIWASRAILVLVIALIIYGNTTGILPFRS
jgi:hypothetical protein